MNGSNVEPPTTHPASCLIVFTVLPRTRVGQSQQVVSGMLANMLVLGESVRANKLCWVVLDHLLEIINDQPNMLAELEGSAHALSSQVSYYKIGETLGSSNNRQIDETVWRSEGKLKGT
uniref:Uncharacterized protein n=1 Tax=Timema genevievae TaxID=629358 RepID=A0A7R9PMA9_TIMGE|nr:unnamed protein product [Timema genevievae]